MNPAHPEMKWRDIVGQRRCGAKFADLHLHTFFSDGTYTPEEVVSRAQKAGLAAIAITDHDTVDGIIPATEIAKGKDVEILPAIEFSVECDGHEIHILGYLIDHKSNVLKKKLEELKSARLERIYKMTEKLRNLGINLDASKVFEIASQGTVGRLHIARALFKGGFTASVGEAFQKYIGDSGPAFVLGFRFQPADAIKLIKGIGGIPVLAHPYSINEDRIVEGIISQGLMGLEIFYPEHSQSMVNFYLGLAKKHNLLVTGGSDCHGSAKPEVRIGSIKLPYEFVEKLKEAKAKNL